MKITGKQVAGVLLSGAIGIGGLGLFPEMHASAAPVKTSQTSSSLKTVPEVITQVSPSVVGIVGKVPSDYADESEIPQGSGEGEYQMSQGSGVIIRSNGWIVTNAHVVDGMEELKVVTADGKSYQVREVYSDALSDIALIHINVSGFKPASFVSSDKAMVVGEQVVAIGTPIAPSLRNSATLGIISGLNRSAGAQYRLIQTDATINPGNSGGPLVNMRGQIIGINSMKLAAVDIDNTGFTIPADTVQYIVHQLFENGEVIRAELGLELEESFSAAIGLPSDDPLTVKAVQSEQAKKAGVKEGDVLYSVAGRRITALVDLNELLKSYRPGQTLRVLMQSGGDIVERRIVLASE